LAITLTQLVAFLAVVRRGSVTAAAEDLVVTQPSVSSAVAALERELGVKLTERDGRHVQPTAAGAAFAPYAADVLGLLERGGRVAAEAAQRGPALVRVSAVMTAGEHLVPPLIQAFGARHPHIEVTLHVGNRREVFARLFGHETDVVVSGRPPDDERLVGHVFAENELVLITAPGDPLARRSSVAIEELGGRPWLVREEGSGTRKLSEEYLAAHGLSPQLRTLGSNGAIKQAVRSGLGVALQSRAAVALELGLGMIAKVTPRGGLPRRHWHVVRSAVGPVRPEVEAFLAFLDSPPGRQAVAEGLGAPDDEG
jgi:DNA-binding transcriptional LysR family regulator